MNVAVKHLLEFGPFRIDPEQRLLLRDREIIPLSPKAFELLLVLVQRSGQVVMKDELMGLLWPDTFVEESNLGQHVFQLRKALGERAQDSSYILTVPGRGYRFAQSVRTVPTGAQEIVLQSQSPSPVVIEGGLAGHTQVPATRLRRTFVVAVAAGAVLCLGLVAFIFTAGASPKVASVRQITHSGRIEPYGKILSDGPRLYFAERAGGVAVMGEAPAGGGEPIRVATALPSLQVYDIDPSRARLLVGSQDFGTNNPLWIVSTAGGSVERVGDVQATQGVAWSPDGRRIFYGHYSEIWVVGEDGKEPEKLLTAPGYVVSLRVAPDGKILRFTVRDPNSGSNSLWEAAADGGNLHPLFQGWRPAAAQYGEGQCCGDWTQAGISYSARWVTARRASGQFAKNQVGYKSEQTIQCSCIPARTISVSHASARTEKRYSLPITRSGASLSAMTAQRRFLCPI